MTRGLLFTSSGYYSCTTRTRAGKAPRGLRASLSRLHETPRSRGVFLKGPQVLVSLPRGTRRNYTRYRMVTPKVEGFFGLICISFSSDYRSMFPFCFIPRTKRSRRKMVKNQEFHEKENERYVYSRPFTHE